MNVLLSFQTLLLISSLAMVQPIEPLWQQTAPVLSATPQSTPAERDGQHDFDFEIGDWKTHISRLEHPLSGSHTWVEYDGTSVVRPVWSGRGNLVELEVYGPAGHIEGLSLRLYNPQSRQWSLNYANSKIGSLSQPAVGEFRTVAVNSSTRNHS